MPAASVAGFLVLPATKPFGGWPMDDDIIPDFLWAFLGGIPFRLRVAVSPPHKACFYAAYMTGFDGYDWPRVGMPRGVIALWGVHI